MLSNRRTFLQLAGSLALVGCGSSDFSPNFGSGGSGGSTITLDPAAKAAQLEADVAVIQAQAIAPGVTCGIWTPTSSWVRTFGRATVNPDTALTEEHVYSWRSATKSFAVTLILQMVQGKQIRLEDPVSRFVPGVPNGDRITLANLADMSSGLFEYTKTQEFIDLLSTDPTRHFDVQEFLVPALAHGVHFEAGSQYEYCNTNTLLLGLVVEAVARQPFATVLQNQILNPLGLAHTYFLDGPDRPAPATEGYIFDAGNFIDIQVSHSGLWAAGAMAGTLADARTWAGVLASGSLITPQLQELRKQGRPAVNGPIYDTYGLGMGQVQGWYGHTGEGAGYAVGLFGEPTSGSQIVILMNASNNDTHDEPLRLLRRFLTTLGWPIPTPADARP
ncbi:hypothetical protein ABS71_13765 [bacterium SCN 62-11]|nr:beta-lactamase family protein [Candidatus Eremiobacteraeota bacterium]ODT63933.1 MAG: hypothetical protein ABS71_13765 [bacterium SCN 62-11]